MKEAHLCSSREGSLPSPRLALPQHRSGAGNLTTTLGDQGVTTKAGRGSHKKKKDDHTIHAKDG